ncbi:hypothetical protein ANAEL_03484 [Anaerolineales bacterium]|nr:hypothetical protein ANAEL_03484 [Anaerolineales bacterium]
MGLSPILSAGADILYSMGLLTVELPCENGLSFSPLGDIVPERSEW